MNKPIRKLRKMGVNVKLQTPNKINWKKKRHLTKRNQQREREEYE